MFSIKVQIWARLLVPFRLEMPQMPHIYYLLDDRTIEIDEDDIILEVSLGARIPHTSAAVARGG